MKRAAVAAALALLASGPLLAQQGEVLKIGFYNGTDLTKVKFSEGVNLIPGNNAQTPRLPQSVSGLRQPGGTASSWTVTALGDEVGGVGSKMSGATYTPSVTAVFPLATVSGEPNGVALQGGSAAHVSFGGLTAGEGYRVTVLGGRGNLWTAGRTAFSLDGGAVSVRIDAQYGADARVEGQSVTANTQSGAWVLMTFEAIATDETLTLWANGANGNVQAVMLEGLGEPPSSMVWTRAGDGAWTDAANWSGYAAGPEQTAYLPEVACDAVTVEAAGAVAKAAVCTAAGTVYTLKDLPDAVAVASSGPLVLADAEGRYGHAVTAGTVRVTGEAVVFSGTAGRVEVEAAPGEASERPGVLTLTGAAAEVRLGRGCTLSGSGTVSDELTVEPGTCLAPAAGTPLTVGAVVARVPDFEAVAWPYGEPAMTGRATVTVRPAGAGCLVAWEACGDGVAFVLPDGVPGTLERRAEGLWYVLPEKPGYRLRLR